MTAKPVLFAISSDPVTLGIAESLARPGRNFTGITFMSLDVAQKRVEILKELMPHLRTLAVLSNTTHPGEQLEYDATKGAAEALSLRLVYAPFASGADIDAALEHVRGSRPDAMLAFPGGATRVHKAKIAEFARAHGLPSMFGSREHCEVGGLASYGANQRATYVRLAAYADRLLRGEKPGDLPIEQPTTFELVLNVKNRAGARVRDPARPSRPCRRGDRIAASVVPLSRGLLVPYKMVNEILRVAAKLQCPDAGDEINGKGKMAISWTASARLLRQTFLIE